MIDEELPSAVKYNLDVLIGQSECRSWLEAEMMPDGQLRLVGMGSRTDFDINGKIISHKCEATGAVMYWPAQEPAPRWRRIFGA